MEKVLLESMDASLAGNKDTQSVSVVVALLIRRIEEHLALIGVKHNWAIHSLYLGKGMEIN